MKNPLRVQNHWLLLVAVALTVTLFAGANVAILRKQEIVESQVRLIVKDSLTSVRFVNRLEEDVEREHVLMQQHILESEAGPRNAIEQNMAATRADYAAVALLYAPLVTNPGESEAWQQFQNDVARLRERLPAVLELSRGNLDAQARAASEHLDPLYARIRHDGTALADLNFDAARSGMEKIRQLQRSSVILVIVATLVGAAVALGVGWLASQLVRRRETAVAQAAARLEERNRELDAFAGRVAHDLRGPLTTISLARARLEARPDLPPVIQLLRRGVERMDMLIDDLLTLSRIDAYGPRGQSNPRSVVAQLAEDFASRLEAEGAVLQVDVEDAQALCSEGLLRQVLWNLTDNALKYRAPGRSPSVQISGRVRGTRYELRLSDNGMGMSRGDAQQAFDPFFRARPTRDRPGTGLGLSIVRRIVEASGGAIAIESQPGQGTTFIVELPAKEQERPHTRGPSMVAGYGHASNAGRGPSRTIEGNASPPDQD